MESIPTDEKIKSGTIMSLHRNTGDISRKKKLICINENMKYMSKSDKKFLLQTVLNSMDRKYIETKGGGTQFIVKYASNELIDQLYYFVQNKIKFIKMAKETNVKLTDT